MDGFVYSKEYILLVVFVAMPINGMILTSGGFYMKVLAVALIALHLPWFLKVLKIGGFF